MGYQEELIKNLREAKNEERINYFNIENDIEKGYIIVKYEKLLLEEKELYEGKINIVLPKDFDLMNDELLKIKYPVDDDLDYVYTSEDTTVNFNFCLEEGEILNEEIEEVRDGILYEFKRMYPSTKMEDIKIIETSEKKIGTFSFIVNNIDGDLFNKMYFIPLNIGLLMLTFSCDIFQKKEWEKIIDDIILTIKEK
ncbi:hypothetical protein [[Clostridium] colinum]|uniref:hypothetical protein n=1 Tax=[Clostridium] colinum TaxID=36835 RepID=UPI0020241C40|nr:hypothetical protein [[Clostridium] colinum]